METQANTKINKKPYTSTVGRRKEAVARIRLFPGSGMSTVNGKPIHEYFPGPILQKTYQRPFDITKTSGKYMASVKVEGGGVYSQLNAVVHGLARALASVEDKAYRADLKKNGLLTRDPRARERRKYGLAGKSRAKKQSPKR